MHVFSVLLYKQENWVLTEHYTIKFCAILKKLKGKMIFPLKKAFQNETLHDSTICRWHRAFMDGRVCWNWVRCRWKSENWCDRCQHQQHVSSDWRGLSFIYLKAGKWAKHPENINSAYFNKELGMKRVCSMWFPHFLQAGEMEHRSPACLENLAQISWDPDFHSYVITVGKSWIHHHNPKMKCDLKAWLHSGKFRMKKICQWKSASKAMLVTLFNCHQMIYQHVFPPKTRISKEYYKMVLEGLFDRFRWKPLELHQWIFHQDNARPPIWLLLGKSGLSVTTLKWWTIYHTAWTSCCKICGCFHHWNLSCVAGTSKQMPRWSRKPRQSLDTFQRRNL